MQNTKPRSPLRCKIGTVVGIAGKVRTVVNRDGRCKLLIKPDDVPGFTVFAEFFEKLEILKRLKIRRGSAVVVRGRYVSYGAKTICLFDCCLVLEPRLKKSPEELEAESLRLHNSRQERSKVLIQAVEEMMKHPLSLEEKRAQIKRHHADAKRFGKRDARKQHRQDTRKRRSDKTRS